MTRFMFCVGVGLLLCVVACSDSDAARATLEAQGFTQVNTMGYALGCGKKDLSCTGFAAIGGNGRPVHGVVSCRYVSLQKTCTVRVEP